MTIRVLVDACLLAKGSVANILLDLAAAGFFELHWTTEIEDETARNWSVIQLAKDKKERVEKNGEDRAATEDEFNQKGDAARARLSNFEMLVPEWRIPGWHYHRCTVELLPEMLAAEVACAQTAEKLKVDIKDRHVALAAMKLVRVFPNDEVWLATENIDDLPPEVLKLLGIDVLHQGILIEELYAMDSKKLVNALQKTIDDTSNPKITQHDLVRIIQSDTQMGSVQVADALRKVWNL